MTSGVRASHCSGSSCCGHRLTGFSSCSMSARRCGFQALAHRLRSCGTRAPWRVGSSHTRDHTCISSTGRGILYHGATREALRHIFDSSFPHMYLVREAGIKRPGSWQSSPTVPAVPSKALGPLASASTSLGLFPPLRNALLWDCSPTKLLCPWDS